MVFIGDSYGAGWTPDGFVTSWIDYTVQNLGLHSNQKIVNALGGAGFARAEDEYKFSTLLNQLTADNDVKYVVICGGYNDIWSSSTAISDGMSACKTIVQTKFPNATLCIGFIGNTLNSEYATNVSTTRANYASCASALSLVSLNNLNVLTLPDMYSSDGIHPNANGERTLATAISNAITTQLV